MKQTTAKLVDIVYFLMKIKREDELIALITSSQDTACVTSARSGATLHPTWTMTTATRRSLAPEHKPKDSIGIEFIEVAATNAADEAMWPPHAKTTKPDA